MVVSDVLRAGLVGVIPFAAAQDVLLVYPIVFLVTAVSIFFRRRSQPSCRASSGPTS
jgi:hypothetical protein